MSNPFAILLSTAAIAASSALIQFAAAQDENSVEVSVSGLRNANGKVWFCLWKEGEAKSFPNCDKHKPYAKLSAPARTPFASFSDVPSGTYAISIYHDEKGNGQLAVNIAGIPRSAVGASNNPAIGMTARPNFNKSRFAVPGKTKFAIAAKYVF